MLLSFAISLLGLGLIILLSGTLALWSSDDPALQRLTLDYLLPASAMVLPFSVGFAIAVGLRSIGRPGLATWASVIGLISNVVLNYALIFGNLGAPALGVRGAAYASALSFVIEAGVVAVCAVRFYDRHLFAPRRIAAYLNRDTVRKILRIGVPIALGSAVWAIGIFVYSIVSAMAGTVPLAVLALVLWTAMASLAMSLLLLALTPALLTLYAGAGPDVLNVAESVFTVLAAVLMFRALNVTMVVGILRAGGDTTSPILMDLAAQWFVAIPLSYACVVVFALPFPWVFLAFNSEEIARQAMALVRLRQFKWLAQIRPNR